MQGHHQTGADSRPLFANSLPDGFLEGVILEGVLW